MKEIQLTQRKITLVDDQDYEKVSQYRWFAQRNYRTFYAARRSYKGGPLLFVHQLIMGVDHRGLIDHKNGNGLDNRGENLRVCSSSQNKRNVHHKWGKRSKYKGVFPDGNKWWAYIDVNKKRLGLGTYETEEIAARVYDAASRKYFGEFAAPNLDYLEDTLEDLQYRFRRMLQKTSNYVGVCWNKELKKWKAQVNIESKHYNVGHFDSEEKADLARSQFIDRLTMPRL